MVLIPGVLYLQLLFLTERLNHWTIILYIILLHLYFLSLLSFICYIFIYNCMLKLQDHLLTILRLNCHLVFCKYVLDRAE